MYWGGFVEGHATAGLTDESTRWAFAEGLAGTFGGQPYETFYLFLNASASPITVTGSFYREDGYGMRQQYTIPANSRFTLYGAAVPHMNGQKFGAVFEGSAPFIAERAVYWGAGRFGGHVSTGTPYTGTLGTPIEPPTPPPPPPPPPPPRLHGDRVRQPAGLVGRPGLRRRLRRLRLRHRRRTRPASNTPCRRSPRAISSTS